MKTETLIKQIARFHKNYEVEFLKERIRNKNDYLKSPKVALFFILSYSFYQGRKNKTSEGFEKSAKKALEEFFKETNPFSSGFERIHKKELKGPKYEEKLKPRYSKLLEILRVNGVNKRGDRLMVTSLINFIESNEEKNLVKLIIQKIKSKNIPEVYEELDNIWSIGPKIASLILRDIVYIYELEHYLDKENYYSLQPVDTWVHQVSKNEKVGLVGKDKEIYKGESRDITDKCFKLGVNPIHYNQGAWYIGYNSLQILLKSIDRII